MASADAIRPTAQGALEGSGLVVDDIEITRAGKRRVIKIIVDRDVATSDTDPEVADSVQESSPVSLDEVASVSRAIGAALEESGEAGNSPYVLEVTSPGLSRPLTAERHFRRNIGRLVEVEGLAAPTSGRLVRAGADGITLKAEGAVRDLSYDSFTRALVQVEFSRSDSRRTPDATEES